MVEVRQGCTGLFLLDEKKRTGTWIAIVAQGPVVTHHRLRADQSDPEAAEAECKALIERLGVADNRTPPGENA